MPTRTGWNVHGWRALVGLALWGGDPKPYYDSMHAIGELPEGAVVADAPCGAGAAFVALSPRQRLRYLALDLSPLMLERARQRARAFGLDQIELVEGDAERIPLENGSVDLFLSYWGLHCMPHPGCRRPRDCPLPASGRTGRRSDDLPRPKPAAALFLRPGTGGFGPGGTVDDLARWLVAAGLTKTRLEVSGAFAYFEASA